MTGARPGLVALLLTVFGVGMALIRDPAPPSHGRREVLGRALAVPVPAHEAGFIPYRA